VWCVGAWCVCGWLWHGQEPWPLTSCCPAALSLMRTRTWATASKQQQRRRSCPASSYAPSRRHWWTCTVSRSSSTGWHTQTLSLQNVAVLTCLLCRCGCRRNGVAAALEPA
jgi:hypothetical protein